ncbi:MAG TPA: 7-carboxy-7-deazaguanine synthase QueE, partial [Cryomorphaceae bacterium]|nr:7-carboxy-7-deazaguanine synthase QueE [Cryomorphaceae bacterium]
EIVANAKKFSETIVVTGGEPLTWNMEPLVSMLKSEGMRVHVETSGA